MNMLGKAPAMPDVPKVTPPPAMPDPMSPANMEAKRQALLKTTQGGRTSTMLTQPLAAGGTYGGMKTGG